MKIIYGSGNKNKVEAVRKFFESENMDIEVLSLKDINFNEDIDENGKTFEENSLIKAKVIKKFCDNNNINEIIITDDAGLCVDALAGKPGVYSARYAGDHAPQEVTINKLLAELKDIPMEKRTARFICVLTAILKNGEVVVARGETEGSIAEKPGKLGGLTYCPIFISNEYGKLMSELSEDELKHTHREKALLDLISKLNFR